MSVPGSPPTSPDRAGPPGSPAQGRGRGPGGGPDHGPGRTGRYLFSALKNLSTIGMAASAPAPPFWTITAKATSPCQPTNQAWVSLEALSNSAVPVLPKTGPPGTARNAVPVPPVTTSRIISRSGLTTAGPRAAPSGAAFPGAGSRTTLGCWNLPRATAAVTLAIASGLTIVVPWPNAAAASSAGVLPDETLPLNESTPMSHWLPMPSALAAEARPSAPSLGARLANAVLHDSAKSVWNGTLPRTSPPAFLNVRPATVSVFRHGVTVSGVTAFFCSSPNADTTLNVDPGGTWPVKAVLTAPPSGPLLTASTDESLTRSATSALGSFSVATAASAAFWTAGSRVVRTGLPGAGLVLNSWVS